MASVRKMHCEKADKPVSVLGKNQMCTAVLCTKELDGIYRGVGLDTEVAVCAAVSAEHPERMRGVDPIIFRFAENAQAAVQANPLEEKTQVGKQQNHTQNGENKNPKIHLCTSVYHVFKL